MRFLCPSVFYKNHKCNTYRPTNRQNCYKAHSWNESYMKLDFCWNFARGIPFCVKKPCQHPHIPTKTLIRLYNEFVVAYNMSPMVQHPMRCYHWQFRPNLCELYVQGRCPASYFDFCSYGTHKLPPNFDPKIYCGQNCSERPCSKEHVDLYALNQIYAWKLNELKMFCTYCQSIYCV